jgi:hypothetical protein
LLEYEMQKRSCNGSIETVRGRVTPSFEAVGEGEREMYVIVLNM